MEWPRRFGRCCTSVSVFVLCFLIFASAVSALASADTTSSGINGANILVRQPREATRSVIAVVGGKADGWDNDNEIWLFDPEKTSNSWQGAGNELDRTRESPAAGSLGKGQLVVAGGSSNNNVLRSSIVVQDVFIPNSVSEGQNMPRTVQRAGYATLDGVLYVAGGTSSLNFGSNSVSNDLYSFDGKTWTRLAEMQTARADLALVADPTAKKLYAIGGRRGNDALNDVQVYDVATNTWSDATSFPEEAYGQSAAFFKGTIYVAGGGRMERDWSSIQLEFVASDHLYRRTCTGWSRSPPMIDRRAHFGLVVYGSHMYAIGGMDSGQIWFNDVIITRTSLVERFDGNSWSPFPKMPDPRSHFAVAFVLGDTAPPTEDSSSSTSLFVLGIKQSQGSSIGQQTGLSVLQYDANELVSTTSDSSFTYDGFAAAIFNERLYVMGGDAGSSHGVSNVKSFDGSNWSTENVLSEPVAHAAAAVFDGKLWLAGGFTSRSDNEASDDVWAFDGQGWSKIKDMNRERAKFALIEYDGKLYAIGGASRLGGNGGALESVEVMSMSPDDGEYEWDRASAMSQQRIQPAAAVAWCRLYVAGGYDSDGSWLESVEFFDGTRWAYAPNMQLARATALAFFDGSLWAFGGERRSNNDQDPSTSVERLASSDNDEDWEYYDSHFLPFQLDSPVVLTGTLLNAPAGKTTPITSTAAATTTLDDAPNDAILWLACGSSKQFYRYTETGFVKQGELSDDLSFSASAVVQNTLYLLGREGVLLWFDGASYQKTAELQLQRRDSTIAGYRGMVWVLGGRSSSQFSNLVNIYDSSAEQWHSGPPMPTARAYLSATAFGGQLYAIGGYTGSSALVVVEVFDGWSWSPAPSLSTARYNHASAVFDDKLYAIGGKSQDLQNAVATVEVFDGISWTSSIALEVPLSIAAATVFNNQLFVAGDAASSGAYGTLVYKFDGEDWKSVYSLGRNCGTPALATLSDSERLPASTIGPVFGLSPRLMIVGGYGDSSSSDVTWLFDGSRWSSSQSPEQQRHSHTLTVFQNKVYAIGGELNDEKLKSVEIFDGLSWTDGPPFPIPIKHHGAAVLRDTLYVIGGEKDDESPLDTIWTLHETDDGSDWEKVETTLSTSRTNAAVATFGANIVIAGGYADGFLNSVDLFDGEAVTEGPPMPTARSAAKAAVFQNRLYVVGGYNDGKFLNIVEIFDGTFWVSAPSMPTARDNVAIGVFDGMLYAIGGANDGALSTVEMFDGNSWESAPPLPKPINSGAACVYPPEPTSSSTTPLPLATTTEVSSTPVSATLLVSTATTTSTAASSTASTAPSTTLTETLITTSTTTTVASPSTSMAGTTPSVTTSSPIEQRALMLNVASREVRGAIFDPTSTSWDVLGTIPVNLENGIGSIEGSATAVAGTALYLIGGQPLENNFLQRTLMFDLTTLTWSRMADMEAPRAFHGAVAVDGGIFALGGHSNFDTVETMEKYDLDKNTWSSDGLPSMSQARSHFAVAALGSDIVVAGGYDANNQLLGSVERYSTDSNKWTKLNELPTPRAEAAMTAVAGKLFLSGGVEASDSDDERLSQTSSMMCWNCGQDDSDDADDPNGGNDKRDRPQRRQRRSADWQSMQNMSPARKGHSMISSGTTIMIAGGEGGDASDVTKLYDTTSNTWTDASLAGSSLSVDDPSSLVLAGISPDLAADAIQAANALSKSPTTMPPSTTPTLATTSHASTTATIPAESTTDAGGKKDGSTGSDDNTTAIIGAAVACVVILLLIIAVVVYNMRQRTNLKVAASLALEEPEYVTNPTFGAPGQGTGPVYADPNAARTQSAHGYVNMASTQAAVNSMADNAQGSSSTAPIQISSSLVEARKVSPPEASGIPKSVQYYDALRPSGQSTTETDPFATASGTYNSLHDAQVAAALSQPLTVIDYAPPDQIRRAPSQHSTSSEYDSLDASGKRRSAAAVHLSGTYDRLHGESSTDDYSVLDASSKRRSAASLTSQGMYDHMQRPHNPVTGTVVGRHVSIDDDENEEMEEQSPSAEYAVPVKNSQRNGRSSSRSQVSSAVPAEPPAEEAPSRPQPGVQRKQPRLRAAAAVDSALPIDLPPASVGLMGAAMPSQGKRSKQGGRKPNKNRGGSRA